jgi:hypothetical protein
MVKLTRLWIFAGIDRRRICTGIPVRVRRCSKCGNALEYPDPQAEISHSSVIRDYSELNDIVHLRDLQSIGYRCQRKIEAVTHRE